MEKASYKLRASDFFPIIGMFKYINRACLEFLGPEIKLRKYLGYYTLREEALLLYNIAIGTGIVLGLEKLLQ